MSNYVICTDSACDISEELLKEWQVECLPLKFRFENEEAEYSNYDIDVKTFYNKMREGGVARTAALNPQDYSVLFEKLLSEGKDVLCIVFSSGLSTTYNSARIAAEEVLEKFPERKIVVVDSLCASAGQGLLVRLALNKQNEGADITETAEYVTNLVPKICHWFTVDDLVYLKRGGRVSPAVALVGTVLGIKPVLHVDNEGHLISKLKVRGRKTALNTLAEKYGELADNSGEQLVYISQADCLDEANYLADVLKEKYGASVSVITDIGPVIGAHAGPGTMALFFVGKER